ncbi:MAG TPA: transglycosylase domain-containing protein [Pyrinomonadaceae bacterium]
MKPTKKKQAQWLDAFCREVLSLFASWRNPKVFVPLILLSSLLALRFFQDTILGASFLRAFIGRGALLGVGAGLIAVALPASRIVLSLVSTVLPFLPHVDLSRYLTKLASVFFLSFAIGFAINVPLTLALGMLYDEDILAHSKDIDRLRGFVTLRYPHDNVSLTLRQRADGSYEHRDTSLDRVTQIERDSVMGAEDRRQPYRVGGLDIVGKARALFAWIFSGFRPGGNQRQGGSGVNEQLAGLLFGIQPRSETSWSSRLKAKLVKTLIGMRVDDLFSRDEQIRLYLSLVSFGSYSGHEVVGLREAARSFYGVLPEELTRAQMAELMARVQSPDSYFPYQRPAETAERYEARHAKHAARARWVLQEEEKGGALSADERVMAEKQIFAGLRSADDLRGSLNRARLFIVFRELRRIVPNLDRRHLEVEVGLDTLAQEGLDQSLQEARREILRLTKRNAGDELLIDAVVLNGGAVRAMAGSITLQGDGASQYKGEIYALARSRRVISSMADDVMPGLKASRALADSVNPGAISLAERIGLEVYQAHLETQGLRVVGPYAPIALGAGVDGSPLTAASMFAKFGYERPGYIVERPNIIATARDANSGAVLFDQRWRAMVSPSICIEVRRALEECALSGTARLLSELARAGSISAKTGTSAFLNKRGQWEGRGGSWILLNDGLSRSTIAVRVRWKSGQPFIPEAGKSAALVALHLLPRLRAINRSN